MTQRKEAFWVLPINVPVDEDRLEWGWNRVGDKLKNFLSFDKQKRLLNKVVKSAKEFLASDPNVQKYVANIMQVYVDNYYNRIWPGYLDASKLYQEGKYFEFLMEVATLYNASVKPLVASASQNMNRVSAWIEKAYAEAHAHYANQYGLQAQREEGAQPSTATASVGPILATIDPQFDFHVRTALVPIPFPFPILIIRDTDDPDWDDFKPLWPAIQPIITMMGKALKNRRKKKKERKHEQVREQDVLYLAEKWARKEVSENSTVQQLASSVMKQFVEPLKNGKKLLKKARYDVKHGDMYNAIRDVVSAYQQTFVPVAENVDDLIKAMKQASAIYDAHLKHFSDYVAKGGKLPKLASAQVVVGGAVYRRTTAAQKAHPVFRWIWEDIMDTFRKWFAEHRLTGKDEEFGPAIEDAAGKWLEHVDEVVRAAIEKQDEKILSKLDEGDHISKLADLLLNLVPLGENPTKEQVEEKLRKIRDQNVQIAVRKD